MEQRSPEGMYHVVELRLLGSRAQVTGGAHAGELGEVPEHVGLIEVAAADCESGPAGRGSPEQREALLGELCGAGYWQTPVAQLPEAQSLPASQGCPAAPLVQMPELSPPMKQ